MTQATWQLAAALLVVAAALFVLARRVLRLVTGKPTGGCGTGGCGTCAPNASATGVTQRPLVQLGLSTNAEGAEVAIGSSNGGIKRREGEAPAEPKL